MPKMVTHDELPKRTRTSPGRTAQFSFNFEPLREVAGKTRKSRKTGNQEPVYLRYEPHEMAADTGSVAVAGTFSAAAHAWVNEFNNTVDGDQKYRAQIRNYRRTDENGDQIRGTVNDKGEIVPALVDAVDEDGNPVLDENGNPVKVYDKKETALFDIAVAIVPLTEQDKRNRDNRLAARKAKSN